MFPLVAKDGGVLMRSVHRGLHRSLPPGGLPAVASSELMNDGTVMRDVVTAFAERQALADPIADLIAYRQTRDKLVKRIGEFPAEQDRPLAGYAYVTPFDAIQHMAFVWAASATARTCWRGCIVDIILDVRRRESIHASLERSSQRRNIVFLRDGAAGVPTHAIRTPARPGRVARSR
jgi:3,4-dihydroxy 2-butanone 4-phosphate synthase/GTP cyclohydrolase II